MSKLAKQQNQSDSDLSLQLSDGSSLSSDTDLRLVKKTKKKHKKKPKKKKKNETQYCVCRKGYDGKEFMIECDQCKEWFHGACVGLKPNSVTDHYFCKSCTKPKQKKTMIVLPVTPKPSLPIEEEDEDEDLCVLCDGDCTCGAVEESLPSTPPLSKKIQTKIIIPAPRKPGKAIPKKSNTWTVKHLHTRDESSSDSESDFEPIIKPTPRRGKSKTLLTNIMHQKSVQKEENDGEEEEEEEEEELIVDDLDDLLDTMSPLSASSSSVSESEEFFTDEDDLQINSSFTGSSVHLDSGDDEDIEDEETRAIIDDMDGTEEGSGMFVEEDTDGEEEEEEEIHLPYYNHWSSSEEDEEQEFDYTNMRTSEEETLLDSEGNLYDTIAAAFMQVMASQPDPNTTTTGTNTPVMGVEYHPLSAFELTHALNTALHHDGISRRPSLPSSTVSAAQRYRGSQDFSTSEALSALVSNDLSLAALEPIQEEPLIEEKPIQSSTHYIEALATNMLLEQTKRKANTLPAGQEKKKKMRSDEPASPAAIIDELEDMIKEEEQVSMDDLVDTSQLYNRSPSPDYEQDEHYSRDLSRWQRIPIGAFRLMRSKNKLWLER